MSKKRFEKTLLKEGALSEPLSQVYIRIAELVASLSPQCHCERSAAIPLAEHIPEAVLKIIMEELSGGVYIPSVKTFNRLLRNRKIRLAFNGNNHKELAIAFDLTARSIRTIVST